MGFRLAITGVAAALAAASIGGTDAVAQDNEITVETTELGDGIFMLSTGIAGNLGLLVGEDGVLAAIGDVVNALQLDGHRPLP